MYNFGLEIVPKIIHLLKPTVLNQKEKKKFVPNDLDFFFHLLEPTVSYQKRLIKYLLLRKL